MTAEHYLAIAGTLIVLAIASKIILFVLHWLFAPRTCTKKYVGNTEVRPMPARERRRIAARSG